jgi:hypothetical protein
MRIERSTPSAPLLGAATTARRRQWVATAPGVSGRPDHRNPPDAPRDAELLAFEAGCEDYREREIDDYLAS